jgi:hypothetical protein
MTKKTFCILEQGHTVNEPITLKKKKLFTTKFSDFYRLNWYQNDPNAFIMHQNIVWSEGRSLLYEKVPKIYDYYIFTDDDVDFYSDDDSGEGIAEKIHLLLSEYKPITGTFIDINQWYINRSNISLKEYLSRECFPISGYDLQLQIFSASFAELAFPVIFHGSDKAMWYSQWICYKLFPLKQICFTEIQVRNIRHNNKAEQEKLPQYINRDRLMWSFNKDVLDKQDMIFYHQDVISNNEKIFNLEVEKEEKTISLEQLGKIYNVNNFDYQYRQPIEEKRVKSKARERYYSLAWYTFVQRKKFQHKIKKLLFILGKALNLNQFSMKVRK